MNDPTPLTPDSSPVGGVELKSAQPIGMARPVRFDPFPAAEPPSRDMLLVQSPRISAWVDIALLLAVMIVFEIVVGSLIGEHPPSGASETLAPDSASPKLEREWIIPLLSARAAVASITILVIVRLRGQTLGSVGLRSPRLMADALWGLATAGIAGAMVWIIMFTLMLMWPDLMRQMQENALRIADMVPHLSIAGFVFLALLIGAYEELVFRGFLLTRLRRGMGSWTPAIVASSALFTLLHASDQTSAALVAITVLALLFSAVTIWRGSIIPAMVAHTAWDLFQFLLLSFMEGENWT